MLRPRSHDQHHPIRLDDLFDDLRGLFQQRHRRGFDIDDVQPRTVAVDVRREGGREARCCVAEFGARREKGREEGCRRLVIVGGLAGGV